MRPRIAEIDDDAVAHELGDESVIGADDRGAGLLIRPDHLACVLGIEPRRERGRTGEIAEHHGELAPLGAIDRCGGRRGRAQIGNGAQQLAAMAERDAEILQILLGEIAKHGKIDVVLGKALLVLGKPERQPARLRRCPCRPQEGLTMQGVSDRRSATMPSPHLEPTRIGSLPPRRREVFQPSSAQSLARPGRPRAGRKSDRPGPIA